MTNKLTVYSNGVTRVQKQIEVKGRTNYSFPVRKKIIDHVLATLGVYGVGGKVRLVEPPSFSNDSESKGMTLEPHDIRHQLVQKLSGADILITQTNGVEHKGKIAGLQGVQGVHASGDAITTVEAFEIVIVTERGEVLSFVESGIRKFEFPQSEVQNLIRTALAKNFQTVRPESILMNLVLEPVGSDKVTAEIDYALPTAAWQSVYKLKLGKDANLLEVRAKVDNPTDEDWVRALVTVIVGEPITFDTDLGEVRVPTRSKVNVVSDRTAGPVRVQEAVAGTKLMSLRRAGPMVKTTGFEAAGEDYGVAACSIAGSDGNWSVSAAITTKATAEEVADFAVFNCPDEIDILANKGGIIDLFTESVEASELLYYDYIADAERSYRAVRMKNTTGKSLGKGVCTVYLGDTLAGTALYEGGKPGEETTLTFSRENGVKVDCDDKKSNPTRVSISLSKGRIWVQDRHQRTVTYQFDNLREDTAFDVEVNHVKSLANPQYKVDEGVEYDATKTGIKLKVKLGAGQIVRVTVEEKEVAMQTYSLNYGHVENYLLGFESAATQVRQYPAFKLVEAAHSKLAGGQDALSTLNHEFLVLQAEQTRLLSLVKAGGKEDDEHLLQWRKTLAVGEERMKNLQKKLIPQAQLGIKDFQKALDVALETFVFTWEAK